MSLSWKTIHGVETYWLSGKENVSGAVVSKECHTVFWDMKEPFTIDSCEKDASITVLPIANFFGKIHLIYWITLIYIMVFGK